MFYLHIKRKSKKPAEKDRRQVKHSKSKVPGNFIRPHVLKARSGAVADWFGRTPGP